MLYFSYYILHIARRARANGIIVLLYRQARYIFGVMLSSNFTDFCSFTLAKRSAILLGFFTTNRI